MNLDARLQCATLLNSVDFTPVPSRGTSRTLDLKSALCVGTDLLSLKRKGDKSIAEWSI